MVKTLILQTLTMFVLAGFGFVMFRTGKITKEGSRTIGNILIYGSLPCVLISSFLVERTKEQMIGLGISAGLGFAMVALCIAAAQFCFKQDPIAVFAASFSNPGFFGIPLILASLGSGCVIYAAGFIACVNLGQWTYGVAVMTGKKGGITLRRLVTAPFFIAIVIGLALFFSGLELPSVLKNSITAIKELNTPLAMFTVGIYLAQTDLKKMFLKKELYAISAVRLLLIPLLAMLILWLLPASLTEMKLVLLIAAACPVGSNIAVYAQLHDRDYAYAVETVVISTLAAIVTLPAMVSLARMLWGV